VSARRRHSDAQADRLLPVPRAADDVSLTRGAELAAADGGYDGTSDRSSDRAADRSSTSTSTDGGTVGSVTSATAVPSTIDLR
jgi:hypothetical protein